MMRASDLINENQEKPQGDKSSIISRYRKTINPPYKGKDFLVVAGTLLLLLAIPLTILSVQQARELKARAQKTRELKARAQTLLSADGFVTANGQSLSLNGQPYRFTGVNRYDLIHVDPPGSATPFCGTLWTQAELSSYFAELNSKGVSAVRFWVFQKFIYTSGVADWSRFDYVLNLAGQYKIKVVLTLENQWSACTEGGYKTESWYNTGYLSPYGSYALSFKNFVAAIVNRYKDDTRIAMWQLMNEAEVKTVEGAGSCGNATIFRNFADDMATDIQTLDPNHLVSFGTLGAGQCGTQGADYKTLHQLASIDVCEYHDYNHNTEPIPTGSNLLSTRIAQCNELGKPLFIGEAGIESNRCGGTYPTNQQRADYFNAKIGAFYGQGGDGYLIWSYRDNDGVPCARYDFDSSDPLAAVLASYKLPPIQVQSSDSDADGFSDNIENYIGTDPTKKCQTAPNPAGITDPNTAWPPDLNGDNSVTQADADAFKPHFNTRAGDLSYDRRFDLTSDGIIDISDVLAIKPYFGTSCS
jgi:mannan endo-1,4-beta-mannosidase